MTTLLGRPARRRLRGVLGTAAALTLLAGCALPADEERLVVYAAASLDGAMGEIVEAFTRAHPNLPVAPVVTDGSASLVTQIQEGAPADIFVSADERNLAKLTEGDARVRESRIIARNTLTIATAPGNPRGISGLTDLADPGTSVVLCAAEVPCGAASRQLLERANIALTPVSEEQSVSAVLSRVVLGEADAGLVYATDVAGAGGTVASVPAEGADAVVNSYPAAVLARTRVPATARAFLVFLVGDEAQLILRDHGFRSPSSP